MGGSRALRMLELRPGEGRPVAFVVGIAFSVSAGLMIGQSAIEALFFAEHGVDRLPVMYLILGAGMFLITIAFGALLARTDRRIASIAVPIAVAVLALAGRLGLAAGLGWVSQALWLLQGAGYFVLGLTVWGIAGIVADTRQAKRFFPLIGAGTVLGSVLGGLVTRPLASWIGTPNLLLVWVATLVAATALAVVLLGVSRSGARERDAGSATGIVAGSGTRVVPPCCGGSAWPRSCSRSCSSRCTCRSRARPSSGTPTPTSWQGSSACSSASRPGWRS